MVLSQVELSRLLGVKQGENFASAATHRGGGSAILYHFDHEAIQMKRPKNYAYWLDEVPPLGITLFSGLQHIGLVCSFLPIPLAVAREAGLADARVVDVISVSMLVLGVTAILQVLRRGPVGSGLLAPSCSSGAYLGPSLLAVNAGELPLVLGMTLFGGAVEAGLSHVLRYLRPYLPPEIAGFVVLLVGVTVGGLGVRYVLGIAPAAPAGARELAVSAVTLGLMVGLNIWGRGAPRLFCALLGIVGGYVTAALLGVLPLAEVSHMMDAPLFGIPAVGDVGWSFDVALIVPFAVAAMAACLKTVGDLTTCQRSTTLTGFARTSAQSAWARSPTGSDPRWRVFLERRA
jgi:xanthine permease XanP